MHMKKQTFVQWVSLKIIVVSFCNEINLCKSLFAPPDHLSLMDFVEIITENKLNKWNKINKV